MAVRKNREEWKIYGNVFDQFTINVLRKLEAKGLFDELQSALALGKEANVFLAAPGRKRDSAESVVVKIYRLENSNFKKMYEYLKHDPRYMHTKPAKRFVIFAWCQREYRNLLLAREAGVRCPEPLAFKENVLVMSLVGEKGIAAKQLKDLAPSDPERFARAILDEVRKLWKRGLVHGDLSAFNILNHEERPVFIDFSQSTPTSAPNARELLERDLYNLAQHFAKLGVAIDAEEEYERIIAK
jgi:RIO kinase 1